MTIDLEYAAGELLLPALRPCVSCADSIVRRAVATLLHSLIEALRFAKLNRFDHGFLDGKTGSNSRILDQVFQLVSQLARDDLTGQRRRLNPDEADWSVLAVSLGPLYSFFTLCRTMLTPPTAAPGLDGLGSDGLTLFTPAESPNTAGREVMDMEEQVRTYFLFCINELFFSERSLSITIFLYSARLKWYHACCLPITISVPWMGSWCSRY